MSGSGISIGGVNLHSVAREKPVNRLTGDRGGVAVQRTRSHGEHRARMLVSLCLCALCASVLSVRPRLPPPVVSIAIRIAKATRPPTG